MSLFSLSNIRDVGNLCKEMFENGMINLEGWGGYCMDMGKEP